MEELVSARIFFLTGHGAGNFLGQSVHFSYDHSCCMISLTVKGLQEFFSQIPPPRKKANVPPYV